MTHPSFKLGWFQEQTLYACFIQCGFGPVTNVQISLAQWLKLLLRVQSWLRAQILREDMWRLSCELLITICVDEVYRAIWCKTFSRKWLQLTVFGFPFLWAFKMRILVTSLIDNFYSNRFWSVPELRYRAADLRQVLSLKVLNCFRWLESESSIGFFDWPRLWWLNHNAFWSFIELSRSVNRKFLLGKLKRANGICIADLLRTGFIVRLLGECYVIAVARVRSLVFQSEEVVVKRLVL